MTTAKVIAAWRPGSTSRSALLRAVSTLFTVAVFAAALSSELGATRARAQVKNEAAAKLANPERPTPESIAAGRQLYARLCVRCHGPQGKGDGGGAGAGGQPADFTDAVWEFGGTDGEIFTSVKDGTSADMDAYGERLKETEMWQLVNFLKSLGPASVK